MSRHIVVWGAALLLSTPQLLAVMLPLQTRTRLWELVPAWAIRELCSGFGLCY
ncbi:MAG: hypothetical protein ACT4QD_13325 [Acidobacteriota bacterium]